MVFPWLIGLVFHSKDLEPEIIITSIREEFIITSYNLGNLNYFIFLRMNSLIFTWIGLLLTKCIRKRKIVHFKKKKEF